MDRRGDDHRPDPQAFRLSQLDQWWLSGWAGARRPGLAKAEAER
jgi:hypothetical protein